MKSIIKQKLVFLTILFFSASVFSHGTIIFTNIEHNKGYIDVKIYDSKEFKIFSISALEFNFS